LLTSIHPRISISFRLEKLLLSEVSFLIHDQNNLVNINTQRRLLFSSLHGVVPSDFLEWRATQFKPPLKATKDKTKQIISARIHPITTNE